MVMRVCVVGGSVVCEFGMGRGRGGGACKGIGIVKRECGRRMKCLLCYRHSPVACFSSGGGGSLEEAVLTSSSMFLAPERTDCSP